MSDYDKTRFNSRDLSADSIGIALRGGTAVWPAKSEFEREVANIITETTLKSAPGAAKNDTEKADLSLCPQVALEAMARAFMVGEKKYTRYNYYKGHKASQLVAALMRHTTAWMEGEENDPVDGQLHLGSALACAAMLLQQQKLGTLIDNRHKKDEK